MQKKTQKKTLVVTAVFAVLGIGYWQFNQKPTEPTVVNKGTINKDAAALANLSKLDGKENSISSLNELSLDNQKLIDAYQDYQSLFHTRDRFRQFFEDAEQLDDVTKQNQFAELNQEVELLEKQKKISNAESLMMKLALLKHAPDSAQAKEIGQVLIDEYKAIAAERERKFRDNPSPQFKTYKQKEKEIVKEVMEMDVYPDGLTREQYLAQRLAELRKQVYR
ncbi:hypothetical protein [Aliikangiella coralliicola]|uniref:Uncharacterized protein n=1 Tax=Aliikangiella coralliicola TaxID=2592383 RepID=A0A545UCQ3_9GAMM|nr:hypothetical protein [Aliikangiella coralliicola]TQV87203.1 hypothetical protein FLL46_15480 [Aliikangiella coralliicola]